ncbi:MAG: 16S rRNA (cytidine(1402)-2'-O)-methyltransferase [Bacilli bacterium]|nr:16S rRNA (cytidine(1402)-2'-O)-methyltransferase [Bacilli bacterium]
MNRELNFSGQSPILTLVATPIGNLQEFSPRAIEVLKECDFVAAEDTRNSGKLLSSFGIEKPFISCHEHNEEEASERIISLLKEGKKVCYMSDAGYPLISDPGGRLVARCLEHNVKVTVTSGPSAAINALVCSGLDSNHFYFEGFLPPKENERNEELRALSVRKETLIFYESPHRITRTLIAMAAVFGPRKAVIARELTKLHEEFIRGSLVELALEKEETLKGEMVIIVEGASSQKEEVTDNMIALALRDELEYERSGKEAVEVVAKNLGVKKNRVYSIYLRTFKTKVD